MHRVASEVTVDDLMKIVATMNANLDEARSKGEFIDVIFIHPSIFIAVVALGNIGVAVTNAPFHIPIYGLSIDSEEFMMEIKNGRAVLYVNTAPDGEIYGSIYYKSSVPTVDKTKLFHELLDQCNWAAPDEPERPTEEV